MSKQETLTESMRRYANIVTEAEQINENWLRALFRIMSGGTEAGHMGKIAGRVSTRLELSDIDHLTKQLKRALSRNPDKWQEVADLYFDQLKSDEFAKLLGDPMATRPAAVIERFEKNFKQLIDAAANVARDPNDVNTKQWTRLSLQVLSQMRESASGNTRKYLDDLFKELLASEADVTNTRWAAGMLAGLLASVPVLYVADVSLNAAADDIEREKNAADPSADTGVDDIPVPKSRPELD